ncbi:MAG: helix-turn-helix transcriptional regulator, partial [Candidatus Micrarchaeia archaeon]
MSKKKESDEIYNLISNQIGDFLREKIKEKGYNIKEIAKSLNVNSSTVYRWITFNPDQRILPKLNMLLKISRVLNLNKKEMKELLNIFYTSQFPNLYGIFPPDENYLKYLCYDGDRNLYEDKLQKAEFYYKLILDSIEKFFGSQKAIKEPFLSIYLHANYGLTYIYVIYKNWNGVKKNINKTRYFLNKLRYSNYYYQNHYIRLVLWVNTQNFLPAKYYYWIDNLEKEIIKYYEEGDDQPLYIHRKEILIAHLERYKALILE